MVRRHGDWCDGTVTDVTTRQQLHEWPNYINNNNAMALMQWQLCNYGNNDCNGATMRLEQ